MASNVACRALADRVAGHLNVVAQRLVEPAHFFTIIPRYGEIAAGDLATFDPELIIERFRSELNRAGAAKTDGILFAKLEAEYQIRTGTYRFHKHGVASGGKLRALNAIRGMRAYHSPRRRPGEPKAAVPYRVRISQQPLFDLPRPLTYCFKPWYARWCSDQGNRGRRLPLPGNAVAEALLWQHHWSLGQVTLLMGMRPSRDSFLITNSTRMEGGDVCLMTSRR